MINAISSFSQLKSVVSNYIENRISQGRGNFDNFYAETIKAALVIKVLPDMDLSHNDLWGLNEDITSVQFADVLFIQIFIRIVQICFFSHKNLVNF